MKLTHERGNLRLSESGSVDFLNRQFQISNGTDGPSKSTDPAVSPFPDLRNS